MITIASALMPNGCDVIASLPKAVTPPMLHALVAFSGQLSLWASGPLTSTHFLHPLSADGGDEGDAGRNLMAGETFATGGANGGA